MRRSRITVRGSIPRGKGLVVRASIVWVHVVLIIEVIRVGIVRIAGVIKVVWSRSIVRNIGIIHVIGGSGSNHIWVV